MDDCDAAPELDAASILRSLRDYGAAMGPYAERVQAAKLDALYQYIMDRSGTVTVCHFNRNLEKRVKNDIKAAVRSEDFDAAFEKLRRDDASEARAKMERADLVLKPGRGYERGTLFGLAYHPIQVSAFGDLALDSLDFGGSGRFTAFM